MSDNLPRDFKGIWISKEIWLNPDLTIEEKVLLAEIHSLNGENGCFASNEYFCKFFNWSERVLQLHLAKLKKLGFVRMESFDGRKRVLRTTHEIFYTPEVKKITPLPCKKLHPSPIGSPIERENKDKNKDKNPPLPPPSVVTPEEEEELNRRFKERPKGSPKVRSTKKWREAVLEDIRQEVLGASIDQESTDRHRKQARILDMTQWRGDRVFSCRDGVEFTSGTNYKHVRYDVSDEEWKRETGWD